VSAGGGAKLENLLRGLPKNGPESKAVDAGQIDAVVDYRSSNVILLPAARFALDEGNQEASIANRLLAALPRAEYQRLLAGFEPLTLRSGEVLHEQGARVPYVYFPVDCVISLLATAEDDQALEVGLVAHEGMVGISLVLGADASSIRAVVQASGTALRMKAARFQAALRQCLPLQRVLYRYAHVELAQARQTVACNSFHAVEARFARWLLTMGDRARSEEFFLTQALVADLLGVRRATVNEAAGPLQRRGVISICRGRIRILDRKGLEAVACLCYQRNRRLLNVR
jgi:CRP-like cAMP-binding protein